MKYEQILEAKNFISSKTSLVPQIGLILGSGLSPLAQRIQNPVVINYKDIPHFPVSTVKGHAGNLVIGTLNGRNVICMQGRVHYYEGYTMQEVVFPTRVMALLGIKTLIVTNAAGGVNASFHTGDIMMITDHINRLPNPLIGENEERLGERFPSMNDAYNKELQQLCLSVAKANNISLQQGVYVGNTGPSFETPAEYKMFRALGFSAVGMSTVPEVIAAVHCGIKVLGLSVISNVFNENFTQEESHEEVLSNVNRASNQMIELMDAIIGKLN